MKPLFSILISLFLFTLWSGNLMAADASFLNVRGFVHKSPDFPALYGAYNDYKYKVSSSKTQKPDLMVGAELMYYKYLGNFQINLSTGLGYTGWYIAKVGFDPPENKSYLLLDSVSDAAMRYFVSSRFSIFGGVRYKAIYAQGDYPLKIKNSQNNFDSFSYYQYTYGPRAGFHVIPEIFQGFNLYVSPSYTYFPAGNSNQKFTIHRGSHNDHNSSEFDLHCAELITSFNLHLYTTGGATSAVDIGLISRYYYQINKYESKTKQRIHEKKQFGYFEISPFFELSFPL